MPLPLGQSYLLPPMLAAKNPIDAARYRSSELGLFPRRYMVSQSEVAASWGTGDHGSEILSRVMITQPFGLGVYGILNPLNASLRSGRDLVDYGRSDSPQTA